MQGIRVFIVRSEDKKIVRRKLLKELLILIFIHDEIIILEIATVSYIRIYSRDIFMNTYITIFVSVSSSSSSFLKSF